MRGFHISIAMGIVAFAISCGTTKPPRELVDARAAYDQAQKGVASQYDPAGVHDAEVALDNAEKNFHERGDAPETRDLAYIALRRAQIAQARAEAVRSMQQVQLTSAEIEKAREQKLEQAQAEIQRQQQQLEQERVRREEAEKRAQQMSTELEKIAAVKHEQRGTVITLQDNVLFGTGKASLLGGAQARLDRIAEALQKSAPDAVILVQGYTDSAGSDTKNQDISEKRANAVRDYLTTKGIPADRIKAQGMGSSSPIGDNATAEGRALNRRVEIVLQTPQDQQSPQNAPAIPQPQTQPTPRTDQQPQPQSQPLPKEPKQEGEEPVDHSHHHPKPKP